MDKMFAGALKHALQQQHSRKMQISDDRSSESEVAGCWGRRVRHTGVSANNSLLLRVKSDTAYEY